LTGHGEEGLLDIAGVLSGCLEEGDAEAVSKFLEAQKSVMYLGTSFHMTRMPHVVSNS